MTRINESSDIQALVCIKIAKGTAEHATFLLTPPPLPKDSNLVGLW
jgi:hypothetical protein